jgi:hypothetical protein
VGFRSELEAAGRGERTALMVRVVHGTRFERWAEQLAHAQGARLPLSGRLTRVAREGTWVSLKFAQPKSERPPSPSWRCNDH